MQVRDGMSRMVLTIGPTHTLRQAAQMMSARRVGAAVVIDPDNHGVGILTERDILNSIAAGEDPDAELAAQHRTEDLVYATPDWTLDDAAQAMVRGGFRHLIVLDGHDVAGLLSMRDIVRTWASTTEPAARLSGRTRTIPGRTRTEPATAAERSQLSSGCRTGGAAPQTAR